MSSIDQVLAELDEVVERSRRDGDRAGYFAVLYREVTAQVKRGLDEGFFDDADRMVRFDALFAERYLDATRAWRERGTPTASWQLAFAAGRRWRPLVLQHLLVGINAHINLDLGIAAARVAPGASLPDLRADYLRINALLATMIVRMEANLRTISPWLGLLDRVGARSRDQAIRFSIVTAREGAWRFAQRLAALPSERWPALVDERDERVAAVGRGVLRPGLLSAPLLLVRVRERSDVAANLDALAATEPPSLESAEREATTATVDEPGG